jgi:predicted ATPase
MAFLTFALPIALCYYLNNARYSLCWRQRTKRGLPLNGSYVPGDELAPAALLAPADELTRQVQAVAALLPERLLSLSISGPQPEHIAGVCWWGSLLCVRLDGLAEHLEWLGAQGECGTAQASALLDQIFAAMHTTIASHGGTLLAADGAALWALFDHEPHTLAAARAALALPAALPAAPDSSPPQLRAGLHSGYVLAATVGDEQHRLLALLGDGAAQAAHACDHATAGEVLLTAPAAARLEHARLAPHDSGLLRLEALPAGPLPASRQTPARLALADLPPEQCAALLRALRPYLPPDLPPEERHSLASAMHPLTALCLDLEWSAAPWKTPALFHAAIAQVQPVARRYGGSLYRVEALPHGVRLLLTFGAPLAHEDDPLRAAHCALDAGAALAALPQPPAWRAGLDTGSGFVGIIGHAPQRAYAVVGQILSQAARLATTAATSTVLLSAAMRTAVEHQIEIHPEHDDTARALRARAPWTALRTVPLTARIARAPLVGRDAELARLLSEAVLALRGGGRVLALVGEAGIGKTRLADALVHHLTHTRTEAAAPGCTLCASECQPDDQHTPYSALRGLLRGLLGLARDDVHTAERLHALCSARVGQLAPHLARFTPLLGDVLGGTLPETPLTRWLSSEQRRDRLQKLVIALFSGAAARKPLLCRLENVHWADASSLEVLQRLGQAAAGTPLLLLLCYRPLPNVAEPWATLPTTTRLLLRPLAPQHSAALLAGILRGTPPAEVEPLLARAGGNPLFLEELVQTLLRSGALARDARQHWRLALPPDQIGLPSSIEGLLLDRLDWLDAPQQDVVQLAAVIGQRFERSLIRHACGHSAPLEQQLAMLIDANIIAPEPHVPESAYQFRHSLLRDVVYAGIAPEQRREIHRHVAHSLEGVYAGQLDDHLARLARHYLLAEEWARAFSYHLAAGAQAQQQFANHDALGFLAAALELVPCLTDADAPPLLTLLDAYERAGELQTKLGAYDEAQAAYLSALERIRAALARTPAPDETETRPLTAAAVRMQRLLASVQERRADYESAFTWLGHGIAAATPHAPLELGRCYLLAGGIYQRRGQYALALEWLQRGLDVIEQQDSRADLAHAYYALGGTYGKLGRTHEAIAAIEQSLQLYIELEHSAGQADAHNNLANVLAGSAGRWHDAIVHAEAALELKEAIGDAHGQAVLANNLGEHKRQLGDYAGALHYFGLALEQFTLLGSDYGMAALHLNMGAVSLSRGALDEARYHLQQSHRLCEQTGSEEFLPELYRTYAALALAQQQHEAALHHADESLRLAQRLDARAEEAATHQLRSQIWQALGTHTAARDDLRQAHALFAAVGNQERAAQCHDLLAGISDDPDTPTTTSA